MESSLPSLYSRCHKIRALKLIFLEISEARLVRKVSVLMRRMDRSGEKCKKALAYSRKFC